MEIFRRLLEPVEEPKPVVAHRRLDAPDRRLAPPAKKPRLPTAEDLALEEAYKQAQIEKNKQYILEQNKQYILEQKAKNDSIKAIIASAAESAAAAEAALAAAAAEEKAKAEAAAEKAARRKERAERKASMTAEDKETMKEKRLLKLVGAVVVKSMSKHSKSFDRDSFKRHAKEVRRLVYILLLLPKTNVWVLVDTNHYRQGEKVVELQGKPAGQSVGRESREDQKIRQGVHP